MINTENLTSVIIGVCIAVLCIILALIGTCLAIGNSPDSSSEFISLFFDCCENGEYKLGLEVLDYLEKRRMISDRDELNDYRVLLALKCIDDNEYSLARHIIYHYGLLENEENKTALIDILNQIKEN